MIRNEKKSENLIKIEISQNMIKARQKETVARDEPDVDKLGYGLTYKE